jgi:hypothetical protein
MSKNLSFTVLHRVFAAGALIIIGGFAAFATYLYVAYDDVLTGDVGTELSPDLLTNLQTRRFEDAVGRMTRRTGLPDVAPDMPDPYDAPAR